MNKNELVFLRESNAIEGVYDADSLQQAIFAWEFLKKQKEISTGTILKLHKILMLHQKLRPDQKGYFRTCQVWVGGREGLSWPLVQSAMSQWVFNANDILVNGKNEDEGFLARVIREQHIKFEGIHPFVDGNGRTGRMLMDWQRLKVGLPIEIIKESKKGDYYKWFEI